MIAAVCFAVTPLSRLMAAPPSPPINITLDPNRSSIEWTLRGNVHEVHGTFRLKRGAFAYNAAAGTAAGEFIADATSGESGNSTRDRRMNANILQADKFPEVRFVMERSSSPVGSATDFKSTVSGAFTLHGETHALTIPVSVKIQNQQITASGSFTVPYVAWGLKDPSTFIFRVEKQVELHVVAVGRIAP